jgi:DNA polymerase-3 subunit alpha
MNIKSSLINYSEYSERFGFLTIDNIVKYAKKNNLESVALTDVGTMYGALEFIQKCKDNNIKPILGVTFNIKSTAKTNLNIKDITKGTITLIAKDLSGYQNLNKLIGMQDKDNTLRMPVLESKHLKTFSKGLVCLTGNQHSLLGQLIINDDKNIDKSIQYFKSLYKEDLYIESIALSKKQSTQSSIDLSTKLSELATTNKIKQVATNQNRYGAYTDEQMFLEKVKSSYAEDNRKYNSDINEYFTKMDFLSPVSYIPNYYEGRTDSLKNIDIVANAITTYDINREIEFPETKWFKESQFDLFIKTQFANFVYSKYFEGLTNDLLEQKHSKKYYLAIDKIKNSNQNVEIKNKLLKDERSKLKIEKDKIKINLTIKYNARLNEELRVIKDCNGMNFTKYFSTLKGFKDVAKDLDKSFAVRGSALSSLVVYLIIDGYKKESMSVDPVYNKLLFQRFLNPERSKYPDIDMDLGDKDEILDEFNKRYMDGRDGEVGSAFIVASTSKFKKIKILLEATKSALFKSESLKKMFQKNGSLTSNNLDSEIQKKYEKIIGRTGLYNVLDDDKKTLIELINEDQNILKFVNSDVFYKTFLMQAQKLQGQSNRIDKGQSQRIVLSDQDMLLGELSVSKMHFPKKGHVSNIQHELLVPAKLVEKNMGLIKYDVLPAVEIGKIENALKDVSKNHNLTCDTSGYTLKKDIEVIDYFKKGLLVGIFQLKTKNGRRVAKDFNPTTFEDIVTLSGLLRPGPNKHEKELIGNKNNNKSNKVIHSELKSTFGIVLFEEQIINLAQSVGHLSDGDADKLRILVSKVKNEVDLKELKNKFINNAIKNASKNNENVNIAKDYAVKVFTFIEDMSGYTFNKGHALRYAMTAYQQMWLKKKLPGEFIEYLDLKEAGIKSTKTENVFQDYIVRELPIMNVEINPIDINTIELGFTTDINKGIQSVNFGLSRLIQNKTLANQIINARPEGGFKNKSEFINLVVLEISKNKTGAARNIKDFKNIIPQLLGQGEVPENRAYLADIYKQNTLGSLVPKEYAIDSLMSEIAEAVSNAEISMKKNKSNTINNSVNRTKYTYNKQNKNTNTQKSEYKKPPKGQYSYSTNKDHAVLHKENGIPIADVAHLNEVKPIVIIDALGKAEELNIQYINNSNCKVENLDNKTINEKFGFYDGLSFNPFTSGDSLSGSLNLILTLSDLGILKTNCDDSQQAYDFIKGIYNNPKSNLKNAITKQLEIDAKYGVSSNNSKTLSYPSQIPYFYKQTDKNKALYKDMAYDYLINKRGFSNTVVTKLYNEGKFGLCQIKQQGQTRLEDFDFNRRTLAFLMQDENNKFNFGQTIELHKYKGTYDETTKSNDPAIIKKQAKMRKPKSKFNFSGKMDTNLFRVQHNNSQKVKEIVFCESIFDTVSRYELNTYLDKLDVATWGVTGVGGVLQWFKAELGIEIVSQDTSRKNSKVGVNSSNSKAVYVEIKEENINVTNHVIDQFIEFNKISPDVIGKIYNQTVKKKTLVPEIGEQREIYMKIDKKNDSSEKVAAFNLAFKGKFTIKTFDDFHFNPIGKQTTSIVLDSTNFSKFLDSNGFNIQKNNKGIFELKSIKKTRITHDINDSVKAKIKKDLQKYFGNNPIKMGKQFDQDKAAMELLPSFDLICNALDIENTTKISPKGAPKDLNDLLRDFKKLTKEKGMDYAMKYLRRYEEKSFSTKGISNNQDIILNLKNIYPDCFSNEEDNAKINSKPNSQKSTYQQK